MPDDCVKFLIDLGLELVILYEHIYEIYGDIQGATNAFNIKAYEQGEYVFHGGSPELYIGERRNYVSVGRVGRGESKFNGE